MHRQIGNAIPWQVSIAIGREFRKALYKRLKDRAKREDHDMEVIEIF
jgi:DNA (cytosine-5)-methyltransferase 1